MDLTFASFKKAQKKMDLIFWNLKKLEKHNFFCKLKKLKKMNLILCKFQTVQKTWI